LVNQSTSHPEPSDSQPAPLEISALEVLTTTRSVRRRLDFERPVDRGLVERCLEVALQAPNGSNRQGWTWVFADEPRTRSEIAAVYRRCYRALMDRYDAPPSADDAAMASGRHLAEHLERCPVLLIPFIDGDADRLSAASAAGLWGSILPAVWSFHL